MSVLFNMPWQQAFDSSGNTIAGAKLYFYQAGTSTPATVYADVGLGVPLSNPVIANGAGRFEPIYLDDGMYKAVLKTSEDVMIWTADNIQTTSEDADVAVVTQAITQTSISAGYTEEEAQNPTNFVRSVYKYANSSNWFVDEGTVENKYVLTGLDDYTRLEDYFLGMQVWFICSRPNTGAATVNVATLGEKNIIHASGSTVYQGNVSGLVHLIYNGSAFVIDMGIASAFPVGSIYTTKTNVNPETILGFGTWQLIDSAVITSIEDSLPVYGEENKCLQVRSTLTNDTSPIDYNLVTSSYTHDGNIDGLVLGDNNYNRVNRAGKVNIIPKSAEKDSNAYADVSEYYTTKEVYIWERTA